MKQIGTRTSPRLAPLTARDNHFTQLDIRIDRTWTFDTRRLMAYLDVRNALNEANSSERIYSYDFSEEASWHRDPDRTELWIGGEHFNEVHILVAELFDFDRLGP